MTKSVGIYHPKFWNSHGHGGYGYCASGRPGAWNNFTFQVNDPSVTDYDFVVVHDDIDQPLKARTSGGGFVLVTGEEKSIKIYNQEFINQFDVVITSRDDIRHPQIIRTHYLHPWWVKRTYEELVSMGPLSKSLDLSAIISDLTILPGHKERFALINKLKGHYKDRLDWFSKAENTFLQDKWDGLAPYKYSIAIENSRYPDYFTEKISDCFLAYAMPFYSGCPNLHDYFDERSFILIDTRDFLKTIQLMNDAMAANLAELNKKYILDSRNLVLNKYNFVAALADVLQSRRLPYSKTVKTLLPQSYFTFGYVKRWVKKMVTR